MNKSSRHWDDVNSILGVMLEISSQISWNMNSFNSDPNLDLENIAEYIAKASQTVIDEMKKQDVVKSGFEETLQKMKNESLIEQKKHKEEFNERKNEIRAKFNKRR